jgi:hypothetical protein
MSALRSMWGWFRGERRPGHAPRSRPRPARGPPSLESLDDRCRPSVTLFPIPTPNTEPEGVTRGPDGNPWFAEIHAVGRITPDGQITEFRQGLSPAGEPVEITAGPDGNIWFAEGVTDRTGRITEFAVPGTARLRGSCGGRPAQAPSHWPGRAPASLGRR